MSKRSHGALERLAIGLALLALADRLIKLGLLVRFFSHRRPDDPAVWPDVSLLQTVTRGIESLGANLEPRARLDYPAHVQHVLVCDAADTDSQSICKELAAAHPELDLRIVRIRHNDLGPAPKLAKLQAGLPYTTGDVLCLMDDDVSPPADALRQLVTYLMQPGVGASFGLACYTNWSNLCSSLLSSYVNTYTLETFVTWSYLSGPVRVVGQMACYWRRPLVAAGGFDGLEGYLDDDFALARRLRKTGLRPLQTPVVYDVNDPVVSWRDYASKFKRWIILPRQAMAPFLTPRQRVAAFLATPATILLPSALAAIALLTRRRIPIYALAATLGTLVAAHELTRQRFFRRAMPRRRWPMLLYTVLVTPVHAALTLLGGSEIEWRGQRLRVFRDGHFERIA
jgi:ceramide glucosyltransferase